jgi:hypothetical protein
MKGLCGIGLTGLLGLGLLTPLAAAGGPGPCEADGKKKPHCPPRLYCCLNVLTPNLKRLWTVCHPPGPFTFTIDWLPQDFHKLCYPCKAMDPLALDINNYLPPDWAAPPAPPSPPLPSWPEGYVAPLPGRFLPTPAPKKAGVPIRFTGPTVAIKASPTAGKADSESGEGKSGSESTGGKAPSESMAK